MGGATKGATIRANARVLRAQLEVDRLDNDALVEEIKKRNLVARVVSEKEKSGFRWSAEEDLLLKSAANITRVPQHHSPWIKIAALVGSRGRESCRRRWSCLHPGWKLQDFHVIDSNTTFDPDDFLDSELELEISLSHTDAHYGLMALEEFDEGSMSSPHTKRTKLTLDRTTPAHFKFGKPSNVSRNTNKRKLREESLNLHQNTVTQFMIKKKQQDAIEKAWKEFV
tara:strand:- start:213 stop:890 length:678 start_codon:yes stop_codon:yes gene_type:complete